MEYILKIKGMVCSRCILNLESALSELNVEFKEIILGQVTLVGEQSNLDKQILNVVEKLGFEVVSNKNDILVSNVENLINEYFVEDVIQDKGFKFSTYLSSKIGYTYETISDAFIKQKGLTIEKYIIKRRIEKVQCMLKETNLTFTEISFKTGFNSVFHLSRQFKQITGITPTEFRNNSHKK